MRYSLLPFPSIGEAGGPDLREQLRLRKDAPSCQPARIDNLELLEHVVELLADLPWKIRVDHCHEHDGDLQLAVVALDLGHDLDRGDELHAGFYLANSEQAHFDTLACERIYRVVCQNGALVECDQEQTMTIPLSDEQPEWKRPLQEVIARSFSADGLDVDLARFRATTTQMIVSPYELLCNLAAQGIITEDEQVEIQHEFAAAADFSIYGVINAVTRIAHRLRDFDDWRRAGHIERLGGEILRGDHQASALDFAFR
jgi:hypothetical protein